MSPHATYVYCLVAAPRRPSLRRVPKGVAGAGRVRLVALSASRRADRSRALSMWLVVADAPLDRYSEDAINGQLGDLDRVSRAAVAHEAVVEAFMDAAAVLPMKLFTLFTSDERAAAHIAARQADVDAIVKRVQNHDEWGVRLVFDRAKAAAGIAEAIGGGRAETGTGYLARRKAQRDATAERAERARAVVADVFDRLARHASGAKRRAAGELPAAGGPLLLDAAFLVPRSRARAFRAAAERERGAHASLGYVMTLTGPWPPYSFL